MDGNNRELVHETKILYRAVKLFSDKMIIKLLEKAEQGFRGWNDETSKENIIALLQKHIERGKGQRVDVANLVMMLYFLEEDPNAFDYLKRVASKDITRINQRERR